LGEKIRDLLPNQTAATRAQNWMQVGRELFAGSLRKLDRFSSRSSPRPPEKEKGIHKAGYLIDPDAGSDSDFSRARNLFSFSLRREWARALKNPANYLSLRAKTCARADARIGRKIDARPQQT
jgi:hypothetical protein